MRATPLIVLLAGIAFIALAITGSYGIVDPWSSQEDATVPAAALTGSVSIGQTFVAHTPRLSAIQVRWIVSDDFVFSPAS